MVPRDKEESLDCSIDIHKPHLHNNGASIGSYHVRGSPALTGTLCLVSAGDPRDMRESRD